VCESVIKANHFQVDITAIPIFRCSGFHQYTICEKCYSWLVEIMDKKRTAEAVDL